MNKLVIIATLLLMCIAILGCSNQGIAQHIPVYEGVLTKVELTPTDQVLLLTFDNTKVLQGIYEKEWGTPESDFNIGDHYTVYYTGKDAFYGWSRYKLELQNNISK